MNQQLSVMEHKSRALFIRALKTFFLYAFGMLGLGTLSGYFIFKEEQTGEEILLNLGFGMLMSIVFIFLYWEKWKEELKENPIESN